MTRQRQERERLAKEQEIIDAAEKLFADKGFETTSMDEVAKMSEFSKRTLYQHFTSKEDLFYAVVLKGARMLFESAREETLADATGFEKVQRIRRAAYRFVREHSEMFRLMSYSQFIKSGAVEASPHYLEMAGLNRDLFALFGSVIAQGVQDGSIRQDFSTPTTIIAQFFITTGFLTRLCEAGDTYEKRFGVDTEALADSAFSSLDDLLRP